MAACPTVAAGEVSNLQGLVLGAIQGLTEFLPISSTAHLRIVPSLLGWGDPGAAFTAVTQLGTMAAVLLFFRADLMRIAGAWLQSLRDPAMRRTADARLAWYIGLGTIPIVVFGAAFRNQIECGARNLRLIALALIALGLVLLAAEQIGRRHRDLRSLSLRDGTIIGLAQALALVPGVSRSGSTISAGLFLGLDRVAAARYSFLLSVPAVVLSGLFELRKIVEVSSVGLVPTALATLVAFVAGYLTIGGLLRFLTTHSTGIFIAYRVLLGMVVLALVASGMIR